MMTVVLILFFISLLGIIIMVGRKLVLLGSGQTVVEENSLTETPFFKEWKYKIIENTKNLGHQSLVLTVRTYMRSANFLKNKHQELKTRIKNIAVKNGNGNGTVKKETNKFLKTISELKHKVREIRHKIKEEENL